MRTGPLKILIAAALFADTVSRIFNLVRIVSCFAMVAAIGITARREHYAHTGDWLLALVASAILVTKLGQWLREEV